MTDNPSAGGGSPQEIMIGPLTASEWASFALPGDDPRNPLPPCCANLSEARDAIFGVFLAGGDVERCWRSLAADWHYVEEHVGMRERQERPGPAALVKLYRTYVAGRERPHADDGFARLMARAAADVEPFLAEVPNAWDMDDPEQKMRAVARMASAYVMYVFDPDERHRMAGRLAYLVGMPAEKVCFLIDGLRLARGMPYEPTWPGDRKRQA